MESISVIPNVDLKQSEILEGTDTDDVIHVKGGFELVGIPRATEGGQVSVAFVAHPEGAPAPVVFETTFALLATGLRGIAAANDVDLETNRVRGT